MEMKKKMVATSQLKLLRERKSSLQLVFSAQLERSNILSSTLLGYTHRELVLIFDIFYSLIYTQDSEPGPLVFDDQPSPPRSPLSPKKPWQAKEKDLYVTMPYSQTRLLTLDTVRMLLIFLNSIIVYAVNHGDSDSLFAIGQTLRIRIGPLMGWHTSL
jgi:hypothetical protein